MNISIVCSDKEHPIYPWLVSWIDANAVHNIQLTSKKNALSGGDLLFLISCHEIIDVKIRSLFHKTLVIHASKLPIGRGWSPLPWQILEGANGITVTLLEAEDGVDSGAIWSQIPFQLEGHELFDEINALLFKTEIELMDFAVQHFNTIKPTEQSSDTVTYYKKRTTEDSAIDINKSINDQFNLLRICDPNRYPAFFDYLGHRYEISIKKRILKGNENE